MAKRFFYTGPHSAITLKVKDAQGVMVDREVMLWHDRAVDLPPDHEVIAVLQQQGLLRPLPQPQSAHEREQTTSDAQTQTQAEAAPEVPARGGKNK